MPRQSALSGRVLIVDDDERQRSALAAILSDCDFDTQVAADGLEALERLTAFHADVIVADLVMPRMDGFELLRHLKERGDLTPAIALTGFGSMDKALSAVHDLRAFWYLEKPVEPRAFKILLDRAIRHKRSLQKADELQHDLSFRGVLGDLVGASPAMLQTFSAIRRVAPTSAPVLIRGESGAGKELVAREIHRCSPRSDGPFVAINAAALPEALVESELFGHEKGAFTGAMERFAGCFEQAHGGTLLLDEIGEMPQSTQPKLLRVLEDLHVRRLGGKHEIAVDARVLAATSQEIGSHLREELYYRLSVFQIVIPPLRERKEDIPLIADVMLQNLNKKHGTRVTGVDPEVLDLLYRYDWPGNVRELRNVLERAAIMAGEGMIRLTNLGGPRFNLIPGPYRRPASGNERTPMLQPGQSLTQLEESYIKLTLEHVCGNRKLAAEMLGISLRTLQNRIVELREEAKVAIPACDGARVRPPLEQTSSSAQRSGLPFAQEGPP
jgi:DNA-binding NtrC family response regulator